MLHNKTSICNSSQQRQRWYREETCHFLHENVANASQFETAWWHSDDSIFLRLRFWWKGARSFDGCDWCFDKCDRSCLLSSWQDLLVNILSKLFKFVSYYKKSPAGSLNRKLSTWKTQRDGTHWTPFSGSHRSTWTLWSECENLNGRRPLLSYQLTPSTKQ